MARPANQSRKSSTKSTSDLKNGSSLGQRIRELRKQRHMTQAQLCHGLVTTSMISQIESDKATPSPALITSLAAKLGVTPDYFAADLSIRADLIQIYRRGRSLMERENYAEALPLIESSIEHLRSVFRDDMLYGDLALCYEHTGDLEKAAVVQERMVFTALERGDGASAVHAYYHIGNMYRKSNQPSLARMYWQRGAVILHRFPKIHMPLAVKLYSSLGRICYMLKRYQDSLLYFEQAVEVSKKFESWLDLGMVWHGMANVYLETAQFKLAESYTEDALRMYKLVRNQRGINQCKVNYGIILSRSGRHAKALEHFNVLFTRDWEVSKDWMRSANIFTERATAHLALNHIDEAIHDAGQALALVPENGLLHASAAFVYSKAKLTANEPLEAFEVAKHALAHIGATGSEAEVVKVHAQLLAILQRALLTLGRDAEVVQYAKDFAVSLQMVAVPGSTARENLALL